MRFFYVVCALLSLPLRTLAIDAVMSHTIYYKQAPGQAEARSPYVEISWQVNPNTLHYETAPDKTLSARFETEITLSNTNGIIKQDKFILKTIPVHGVDEILLHSIVDLRNYDLPAGLVRLKFKLLDVADTTNKFMVSDCFTVPEAPDHFFFSGIELLDTAYKAFAPNQFTKDGMQHVPLSTNFLDDKRKMFYYYCELYAAGKPGSGAYPLIRKVAISKSETEGFYANFVTADTIKSGVAIMPRLGRFDIAALPSGNYYLRASLEDSRHNELASQTLFFQRLNKHPLNPSADTSHKAASMADTGIEQVTVLNLKKTFIAKYNLAQIRAILKMLLPFSDAGATKTINDFLRKPDEIYMRYYIYNYFAAIDKDDPGRAWREFAKKIEHVNDRFKEGSTLGYETERGFMYLRYGPPTDIITVENEQGSLPYEIWQYNTLTQMNHKSIPDAIFLFYRPSQITSGYQLLHSTVEGEIQTPQWRSYLYTTGQGGGNLNSRAEQYIGNR